MDPIGEEGGRVMTSGEKVVTGDGVSLWTASGGEGPPMVLCHGGPGLWDDLEPVAARIEDLVTVHRWDQRGCGRSGGDGPYTIARFVADLESLRERFGYERWIVGGHSWGATLALCYALQHPERVRALVYLCGTGIGSDWREAYREEIGNRLTEDQLSRISQLEKLGGRRGEEEEREYRTLAWLPDYADREGAMELAAKEAGAPFAVNYECNAALNAEVRQQSEEELRSGCERLEIPAFIVHGGKDPRPAWALESMIEALPWVKLRVLPGVGHVPWLEDREVFTAALRGFLKSRVARLHTSVTERVL